MAITPAITGDAIETGTSEEQFFTGKCTTLEVVNEDDTISVHVRVPELHGETGYVVVPPASVKQLRVEDGGLTEAYVASVSGTPTIRWAPISKTRRIMASSSV